MDEEFIDGPSLQGLCGNFHRKTVRLEFPYEDYRKGSKDIVEQVLPAGYWKICFLSLSIALLYSHVHPI